MIEGNSKVTNCKPVRYELIDKYGEPIMGGTFKTAAGAVEMANFLWPDEVQDEDRTGRGWDIQVVGAS